MTLIQRALLCAPLVLAATVAHAGRPLATEDADTLKQRDCEFEAWGHHGHISGSPSARGATVQVGCGFGWRSQAALATDYTRQSPGSSTSLVALGKTGLIARDGQRPGLTIAWSLSGEKASGGSFKREGSALALVATHEFAKDWLAHANLGWSRSHASHSDTTTWNLALERPVGGGWDLMGEVYGDDRDRPWLGVGARWSLSEKLSLNASWAEQNSSPRARLLTLGMKLAF